MSIFKNVFAALSLLTLGTSASAAWPCVPAEGPYMNPISGYVENRPRFIDSSRNCYVPQGTSSAGSAGSQQAIVVSQQQWRQRIDQEMISMPRNRRIPEGYCTWEGRATNMFIGGILGAIGGAIVGDSKEATRIGFGLGYGAGTLIPCATLREYQEEERRQVLVQRRPVQVDADQNQQLPPVQMTPRSQADTAIQAEDGDFVCPLVKNGQTVRTYRVKDDPTCRALLHNVATSLGWIRQN